MGWNSLLFHQPYHVDGDSRSTCNATQIANHAAMTLPQKFINGQLYHFAAPDLVCRADMLNAVVVEATVHGHHALILTANESEAESVLRGELTSRGIIPEY
jgi:hypothetical protein